MKKFYILLTAVWLLSGGLLRAQTADPLRQKLDQVFANINKSQVPTGYLEEYGTPLIPLDLYNGTLTDSSITNIDAFRMAYLTYTSSLISGSNVLPTITDLNNRITSASTSTTEIPVAIAYMGYATLRPDALTSNLLSVQNGSWRLLVVRLHLVTT